MGYTALVLIHLQRQQLRLKLLDWLVIDTSQMGEY